MYQAKGDKIIQFSEAHALMTVQVSYAPGDHGFGLKRRLGIPFGILLDGI
jgi:hypothetical protein